MLVIYRDEGDEITVTDSATGATLRITVTGFSHGIMNASVTEDYFHTNFNLGEDDDFKIGTGRNTITVRLLNILDSKVKLGFVGPKTLKIWRTEIQERINAEGKTI